MASIDVKSLRVLVVEDNDHFRTLVRTILQALGVAAIEEARDGGEALEKLGSFDADVAILDWKMDGVDGLECVRRIRRAGSPNRFLAVLMVTGYTEASLVRQARDAGVDDFLGKPISAKSLMARLVSVLEHPRDFVETADYFGPDRRRRDAPPPDGRERRHSQVPFVERE